MICQSCWKRVFVGLVVVFGVSFLLVVITGTDLDIMMPELSKSMLLTTNIKSMLRDASSPTHCQCSMKPWQGEQWMDSFLNLTVPWLNTTTLKDLQEHHPNLPHQLLNGEQRRRCSLLPTIFSIDWMNKHWQRATLDHNDSFFLYSAFFDPETGKGSSIRLLGVSRSKSPTLAWCHVWLSSDAPPLAVKVTNIDYLDYQGQNSQRQMPYLLRCPLPPGIKDMPLAVSLTSEPCAPATNLLKVVGGRQREVSAYRSGKVPPNPTTMVKGWAAAVCGPALFYYHEDFSLRLVEWLELLRAQGFSQVFLYATDVHPNINKVLRHYTQEGFVQVTDYTYPPPYLNEPSLRRLWVSVERPKMFAQENVYFTDCVLRHMHQYRFLAHFDPDELPILPNHDNFTHFLDHLIAGLEKQKGAPAGYRFQWSFFYSNLEPSEKAADLPSYLWILRHTKRSPHRVLRLSPGKYKPLYDMNAVRGVFSHGSLLCLSGSCHQNKLNAVPANTAFLGHFKMTCDDECRKIIMDDLTLQKYKDEVSASVKRVLTTLELV